MFEQFSMIFQEFTSIGLIYNLQIYLNKFSSDYLTNFLQSCSSTWSGHTYPQTTIDKVHATLKYSNRCVEIKTVANTLRKLILQTLTILLLLIFKNIVFIYLLLWLMYYGILLLKLFWHTARKKCSSDWEKTFEIRGCLQKHWDY